MKRLLALTAALLLANSATAATKCAEAKAYLEKHKTELKALFKAKNIKKVGRAHRTHGPERLKEQSLQKISDLEAAIAQGQDIACDRLHKSLESSVTRLKNK